VTHARDVNGITANDDLQRFQNGADKYAAYLETPEGRLRLDLAFANLQEFLPQVTQPLRALDLGGGTGALAVRLAKLGLQVTLLDASVPMLNHAKAAARDAGVADRVTIRDGDVAQLASLFDAESFDLVLCHNLLEYVEEPCAVLCSAVRLLRDTSSIISVLVRNQAGEVLKEAILHGDLPAAANNLTADSTHESLYGGRVRLFTAENLHAMLTTASLTAIAQRGVRVVSDYLPPTVSRSNDYQQIFELERRLGRRPEFVAVARYTHHLAHRKVTV